MNTKEEIKPTHKETFIVDAEHGCETCRFCGWSCELAESHLISAMRAECKYIKARYDIAEEMEREFA